MGVLVKKICAFVISEFCCFSSV